MPKVCQNGFKIDAKTHYKSMPKLMTKKSMEIIENHVSLNGKPLKFIIKTNVFEGLAVCVRERKRYQKTSKMIPKSIPKWVKNQCNKYRNPSKLEPKREATIMNNQ